MTSNSNSKHTAYSDDAMAVRIINNMLDGKAMRPPKHKDRRLITAKLSQVAIKGLQDVALKLGYVWNDQGNISMLLEAIGTGTIQVQPTPIVPRHLE